MVGYNEFDVKYLLDSLNNYNKDFQTIAFENFQQKVVVGLSESWYAPKAQERVTDWCSSVIEGGKEHIAAMREINGLINGAAKKWAEASGATHNPTQFDEIDLSGKIDATIVKDNNNGFRGMLTDKIPVVIENIKSINFDIKDKISEFNNLFSICEAFMGEEQIDNLRTKLWRTMDKFTKNDIWLLTYALEDYLEEEKEKYQQTAKTNAQTFASSN